MSEFYSQTPSRISVRRLFNALIGATLLWSTLTLAAPSQEYDSVVSKRDNGNCKSENCKHYDIVIYGSTPAGIAAAIQARRMNKTTVIVTPDKHLGGLTASGLGWTDSKNGDSIGGIAREFYTRIYKYYTSNSVWHQESRSEYMARDISTQPGGKPIHGDKQVQWTFEPHVAEYVLEDWMKHGKIPIVRGERIRRDDNGVSKSGASIKIIEMESGAQFSGKIFIDATYEGDLAETAGIPSSIGRESTSKYGESLAGMRINIEDKGYKNVDPYIKKGDASSGLLPGIARTVQDYKSLQGQADPNRLQSYNYRLPLTKVKENRIAFTKPANYNESEFELLLRYIEAGKSGEFFTYQLMPNLKTDTNAQGLVSTDLLGGNYDSKSNYVLYSYKQREEVARKHKEYTQGFFWTLTNNPRVPKAIRDRQGLWGWSKDEFTNNGNFPYSIYVRETRRMEGLFTMTQKEIQKSATFPKDSVVGLGCYFLDSHVVERVNIDGHIYDEGQVHVKNYDPFAIPYNVMVPKDEYATNLLNPVTVSSSHVANSAIRMEPTYWILGQSAATAAVHAMNENVSVQNVDRKKLTKRLQDDKQKLSW